MNLSLEAGLGPHIERCSAAFQLNKQLQKSDTLLPNFLLFCPKLFPKGKLKQLRLCALGSGRGLLVLELD